MQMTPFEEFEALDRIFNVIRKYWKQREDQFHPRSQKRLEAYFAQHLVRQDLQLWLRLEAQDSLSEFLQNQKTNGEFKSLLNQFKQAAHGLSKSWHQSHNLN
ncbi:hypothetical protein [Spirosoma endbachense]|uniref:Uncharacterized protein n=1 Tax=Spirosoma endbachense TaxID=2666025 RepID=A0A6P1W280_9BACT|nr:hypothetical protein [Spirosoma endbachense]QHV97776.1 hypothetical protein GJR95_23440 [Spirosoma endbachense]